MKQLIITDKDKLEKLIKEAKLTPSEIARALEVTYRSVHRWLKEGVSPHPRQAQDLDELFKEYIDLSPLVDNITDNIPEPINFLKKNKDIREKFFVLMTYHSNAIEGSRMTQKETEMAIEGKKVKGKETFEILEAINHHNALLYMLDEIKPNFKITEEYILKLHSIIMYNFNQKLPGKYRTGFVNLTNTEKKLPSFQRVPIEMRGLTKNINNYHANVIKKASHDHYQLESIHPFFDGNGRTGRLILLTQLLSKGYPPAIIEIEDRYKYYMALSKGDIGEFKNLVQMVCDSILKGYHLLFA